MNRWKVHSRRLRRHLHPARQSNRHLSPHPNPPPSPARPALTVNQFIDQFASFYAVDPNVLRHIALCESGFNSNAVNGPYAGLYQFNSITWKNLRLAIGKNTDPNLRFSAEDAVQTAAYELSIGKGGIWPNCSAATPNTTPAR